VRQLKLHKIPFVVQRVFLVQRNCGLLFRHYEYLWLLLVVNVKKIQRKSWFHTKQSIIWKKSMCILIFAISSAELRHATNNVFLDVTYVCQLKEFIPNTHFFNVVGTITNSNCNSLNYNTWIPTPGNHDAAPPHTKIWWQILEYSVAWALVWPVQVHFSRSPDLTSPEFFICGLVKDKLYFPPTPTTLNNLKDRKQLFPNLDKKSNVFWIVQCNKLSITLLGQNMNKNSALFLVIAGFQFLCGCNFLTSTFM